MSISRMMFPRRMVKSDLRRQVHRHPLIKNEDYDAREGDLCYGCGLLLCKSSVVYQCTYFGTSAEEDDCARFFIHKTCANLPGELEHPSHRHPLNQSERPLSFPISGEKCHVCGITLKWFTYYCASKCEFQICLACAIPINKINIHPPYHRHKLTFQASLATFRCDACNGVATEFSYMCYTCPFRIHLSCNNLPALLACHILHKHPLRLAYSLPENHRRFRQFCGVCGEELLDPGDWLYYCPDCRFFAHINCATDADAASKLYEIWSRRVSNPNEEYSIPEELADLLHLPVPEYKSLLGSISWLKDAALRWTPPDHINHWSHEHQLLLTTTSEEEILPICNGCTESISIKDGAFNECRECEYILHICCAQFPKEMSDPAEPRWKLVAIQPSVHDIWSCARCKGFRNGTQMQFTYEGGDGLVHDVKIDSSCALLPERIVHKAHYHNDYPACLFLSEKVSSSTCLACNQTLKGTDAYYVCSRRYCKKGLHIGCALKPLRVTHRWDPHPLHLTTSAEEVIDHPHEFQCEFCSEEIDTNYWFYHCSVCDLSCHFNGCIDLFPYSRVKFGATNIMLDAHQHGLTFVLNKRHQPCDRCHKDTFGKPVLQCAPCKFVQHAQPDLCS